MCARARSRSGTCTRGSARASRRRWRTVRCTATSRPRPARRTASMSQRSLSTCTVAGASLPSSERTSSASKAATARRTASAACTATASSTPAPPSRPRRCSRSRCPHTPTICTRTAELARTSPRAAAIRFATTPVRFQLIYSYTSTCPLWSMNTCTAYRLSY